MKQKVKIKMSLKDCWKCQGHVEAQSQYKESKALKMLAIKVKAQEAFLKVLKILHLCASCGFNL